MHALVSLVTTVWSTIHAAIWTVVWFVHDVDWAVIHWLGGHPMAIVAGVASATFWGVVRHDAHNAR
jgi:hypothetical protein